MTLPSVVIKATEMRMLRFRLLVSIYAFARGSGRKFLRKISFCSRRPGAFEAGAAPGGPAQPCAGKGSEVDLGMGTGLRALGVPSKTIPRPEWLHPNVTLVVPMPPPFGGPGDAAGPLWPVG